MLRARITMLMLAILLSACTLRESIYSPQPDVIRGTLVGGLAEQPRVEIELNGKTYVGVWRTSMPSREQLDMEPSGHRRHMRLMEAEPTAADGDKLICAWMLHGTEGSGSCKSGAASYRLDIR